MKIQRKGLIDQLNKFYNPALVKDDSSMPNYIAKHNCELDTLQTKRAQVVNLACTQRMRYVLTAFFLADTKEMARARRSRNFTDAANAH